jgi:hypothetical protein
MALGHPLECLTSGAFYGGSIYTDSFSTPPGCLDPDILRCVTVKTFFDSWLLRLLASVEVTEVVRFKCREIEGS